MPRARTTDAPPAGLVYRPGLLTVEEERALLARLERAPFEQIVMKGVVARRTALRYGYGYDYDRRAAVPEGAEPIADRRSGHTGGANAPVIIATASAIE